MISDSARTRMAEDFTKQLPTWTNEQAAAFHRSYGEIVSVSVRRAIPYGVTATFVSATGAAFGPMLLNPLVVEQLTKLLHQEGSVP